MRRIESDEPLSTVPAPGAEGDLLVETSHAEADPATGRMNVLLLGVLGAVTAVLIALVAVWPMPAYDLWWQLKTGELIWNSRSIPKADVFSHTAPGDPWVVQEWLTEVMFYLLHTRVGAESLVWYKMVAISAAFSLLLWRCWVRTRQPLVSVAFAVLAAYAARPFFDIRPQALTYLFLAIVLLLLDGWRVSGWRRAVWGVPAVILLWVNCHGGFMMGLVVVGVELVGAAAEACLRGDREDRRWRTLAGVLGLSVLAGLVNPHGIQAYIYPFTLLSHNGMLDSIGEWLSPNFHLHWLRPYELLLIGAMLCWGVSASPRRTADVILVLGLIHSSLYSTRHVPIFAIVCAPIVAQHAGSALRIAQAWLAQRVAVGVPLRLAAAAAVLVALLIGIRHEWRKIPARDWFSYCAQLPTFPKGAVDFIQANPGIGNLFNEYNWGGYCLYRLYPEQKIFVDGRAEVYFRRGFADYSAIINLQEGWGDRLEQFHIDTLLLPADSPLAKVVLQDIPGWSLVYQDPISIVLRKQL